MKKTLIALMALSCMALANEVTSFTWDTSAPYKDCTTIIGDNGTGLDYSSSGWWVSGPTATLETPITLKNPEDSLTLSFSYNFDSSNSVFTMALVNDKGAVVMGKSFNENGLRLGSTTETGDAVVRGYAFANTNDSDHVANITDNYYTLGASVSPNTAQETKNNDIVFSVNYDTMYNQFVGTLTFGGKSTDIALGQTYTVNAITATFCASNHHVRNISLTYTPEPATATLSLLALVGLASRRRRH